MTPPLVDPSWHRTQDDTFDVRPSPNTPFDHSSRSPSHASDSGSEWSYVDTEELITLDLGTDRIARRALLGYSAGLDHPDTADQASGSGGPSFRTVRGSRGAGVRDADRQSKRATGTQIRAGATGSSAHHLGTGKMLSLTGLDTNTPLMKINDTVLRGKRMDMFGTEIMLVDHFDPTRPTDRQHQLQPIPPSTTLPLDSKHKRPTLQSSTTRKRILFRPIYDPTSRETSNGVAANYDALRALVKPSTTHHVDVTESRDKPSHPPSVSVASLMGVGTEAESAPERGVGRGKYKRKPVPQHEQMIRSVERKIRKAAKIHLQQQQRQQQHDETQSEAAQAAQAVEEGQQPASPPPPLNQS